jgi:cold shock CspA family protein
METNMNDTTNTNRVKGTVSHWNRGTNGANGGYGFITPEDQNQPDIFVHFRSLRGRTHLVPGMIVEYEPGPNPANGKPAALDVEVLIAVSKIAGLEGLAKPKTNPLDGLRGNGLGRSLSSLATQNNLTDEDDSRGNR